MKLRLLFREGEEYKLYELEVKDVGGVNVIRYSRCACGKDMEKLRAFQTNEFLRGAELIEKGVG
jgi:hypothetical protein